MKSGIGNFSKKAFTLIELSVVLVIIGLLISAILFGQSLIKAARLRSVSTQQEQFKTATATFISKFNCLPGDCSNGASAGFINSNADGNGKIGDNAGYMLGAAANRLESLYFWQNLYQAGFIASNGIAANPSGYIPANIRSDSWWISYSAHANTNPWPGYASAPLGNVLALVGVPGQCGYSTCGGSRFSEGLTPAEALAIDSKIDDGMPNTGNVQAVASGNWIDSNPIGLDYGSIAPDFCINGASSSATSTYAPAASNYNTRCNLLFKLGM